MAARGNPRLPPLSLINMKAHAVVVARVVDRSAGGGGGSGGGAGGDAAAGAGAQHAGSCLTVSDEWLGRGSFGAVYRGHFTTGGA
jgi:hypothetical protein